MTMTDAAAEEAQAAEAARRAAYTAGLRQIADWLDGHPEVKLPFYGTQHPFTWSFSGGSARAEMAAAVAAFPGRLTEKISGTHDEIYALTGTLDGVAVQFQARRVLVCTVTGYENRRVPVYGPGPLAAAGRTADPA
jgi:hypothetical protein